MDPGSHGAGTGRDAVDAGHEEDRRWLQSAISLAVDNVAEGGGPFGALVVRDGTVIGRGINRVTSELDPTAHAEVVAIRRACRAVGDFSLAGATLFASCEPCPLCLAATLWARIPRVRYAADRHDAARAGFDDATFHDLLTMREDADLLSVEQVRVPGTERPFDVWLSTPDRIPY